MQKYRYMEDHYAFELWKKVCCIWNIEEKAKDEMHILLCFSYDEHKCSDKKITSLLGKMFLPGKVQCHRGILKSS